LDYEIDGWDSAAGRAQAWVKLDTVYGNDSTHYFTMLWGNPGAQAASNAGGVFDTIGGLVADMHCGPEAVDVTDYHRSVSYFGVNPWKALSALRCNLTEMIRYGLAGCLESRQT